VCLRYFNVFGPRQDPASQYAAVIPRFLRAALRGERPVVFGDGEQTRDFTFVANVVDANLRAMRAPEAAGRVFNIAAGARTSLRELLTLIGGLVGRTIDAQWAPARGGEVKHSQGDVSLARGVLGYAPYVDLAEGLRRTLEWYASAEG
jgi:nucleoside-diphosphate-sugar epimerase